MHTLLQRMLGRAGVLRDQAEDDTGGTAATGAPPTADTASTTTTPESSTTDTGGQDEFADAFSELTLPKANDGQPAAPPAAAPASTATEPAPAATSPEPSTPPAAAPAPAAEPTPPADDGRPSAEQWQQYQDRLAALEDATPPAAAPAPAPAPAAPEQPLYTAEEQTKLVNFQKEWPDVHEAIDLYLRAHGVNVLRYAFEQVQTYVQPAMAAVARLDGLESTTQYSELKKLVPDYDEARDPTIAWIDTQPDYLKDAYTNVTQNGTPEQVADLIVRFKKETGWQPKTTSAPATPPAASAAAPAAKAPPAAPAAPAPKPATKGMAPAAAAAAAALAPVAASRTSPASAADPNDFDAGFAEAVAQK